MRLLLLIFTLLRLDRFRSVFWLFSAKLITINGLKGLKRTVYYFFFFCLPLQTIDRCNFNTMYIIMSVVLYRSKFYTVFNDTCTRSAVRYWHNANHFKLLFVEVGIGFT